MPRKQKKYHFIYKTTNLITDKFYMGMHSTNDLEDGYLGSGRVLIRSINKYGKENHKTERLEFFETRKELKNKEIEIINESLLEDPMCMNLQIGGSCNPISNLGSKRSKETKIKMSIAKKGINKPENFSLKISKPVIQLDNNENFIQRWSSATSVYKKTGISNSNISNVCKRLRKSAGGFKWKWEIKNK